MERTEFSFTAPKKKKRVRASENCPLPISIESWCGYKPNVFQWHIATGVLHGSSVLISDPNDIERIYYSGFFGKGNLSGRGLDFTRLQEEHEVQKSKAKNSKCLKVISRRRYLSRCRWAAQAQGSSSSQLCDNLETLPYPKKIHGIPFNVPVDFEGIFETNNKDQLAVDDPVVSCTSNIQSLTNSHQLEDLNSVESQKRCEDISILQSSDTEYLSRNLQDDPWEKESEEAAAFWFSETDKYSKSETIVSEPISMNKFNEYSNHLKDENTTNSVVDCFIKNSDISSCDNIEAAEKSTSCCDREESVCGQNSQQCLAADPAGISADETVCLESSSFGAIHCKKDQNSMNTEDCDNISMRSCEHTDEIVFDNMCVSDEDDDADLWVVDDSSDSEMDESVVRQKPRWKNVTKSDPYPMKEQLQLGLEEAFFLSFGLGCLVVKENEQILPILSLWRRFLQMNKDFLLRYVVYHNLRSKGWVPRSGIKYGADFVLYKKGPPFYHSTYLVFVREMNEEKSRMSWTELACLNRVTEQVSKEVMFCYVMRSSDISAEELSSPKCLHKFKVSEVIIRRWISKRERDNAEYLQLP